MPDQDNDRNRYWGRNEGDDYNDDVSGWDRMNRPGRPGRRPGRRFGYPEDEERMMDRGYYGQGRGYGESPYTSEPPNYAMRSGTGESPYTDYGPQVGYPSRMRESPYTNYPPRPMRRYGTGESPYTDWGPSTSRFRDMDEDMERDFGPVNFTYWEFWMVPGPESGRGPQGYSRSDQRILEDVNDRLMMHGRLDARDINVQVQNGEVTLTGTVAHRRAKRMAEDVADSVMGVTDVKNEIKVKTVEKHPGDMGQVG